MSNWSLIAIGLLAGVVLLPLSLWLFSKIAVWFLTRKLGALVGALQDGATDVPLRVTLRKAQSLDWMSEDRVQCQVQALLDLGFQSGGDYTVAELGEVSMASFTEPKTGAAAYLCKHPALPLCFLDMIHVYEDGTSLTVSNLHQQGVDSCPAHPNVKLEGATPEELFTALLDRSRGKRPTPIQPDQTKETYERGYAAIMDWRVEKGGVSDEEIGANSQGEMSEEEWENAREIFHQQHLTKVGELLRIRFSEQTQMSIQEWEGVRENLIFVHDRLRPQDVQSLMAEEFYGHWQEKPPLPQRPGRAGFEELLDGLKERVPVSKIGLVSGTIEADVYHRPEALFDDC